MDFGKEVREAISELGIYQKEVCKETGISLTILGLIFHNVYNLDAIRGKKLCDYLGISFTDFISWSYAFKRIRALQIIREEIKPVELPSELYNEMLELQGKYVIINAIPERRKR